MAEISIGCRIRATCVLANDSQIDRILGDPDLRADSHSLNFNVAKFEIVDADPALRKLLDMIENREQLDFELFKSKEEFLMIPPVPIIFFSSASERLANESTTRVNESILHR